MSFFLAHPLGENLPALKLLSWLGSTVLRCRVLTIFGKAANQESKVRCKNSAKDIRATESEVRIWTLPTSCERKRLHQGSKKWKGAACKHVHHSSNEYNNKNDNNNHHHPHPHPSSFIHHPSSIVTITVTVTITIVTITDQYCISFKLRWQKHTVLCKVPQTFPKTLS